MQYCELNLAGPYYRSCFLRLLRRAWEDNQVPKHLFRGFLYRRFGVYIRLARTNDLSLTVTHAWVIDQRKYTLFVIAYGDYLNLAYRNFFDAPRAFA